MAARGLRHPILDHSVVPDKAGPSLIRVPAPAPQIPARYFDGADLDALRRTQQRGVWLTDVLLAALEQRPPDPRDRWLIAGALNLAETFDAEKWSAGGNTAWLDRMRILGSTECLRRAQGRPIPTFQHSGRMQVDGEESQTANPPQWFAEHLHSTARASQGRLIRCHENGVRWRRPRASANGASCGMFSTSRTVLDLLSQQRNAYQGERTRNRLHGKEQI
jgi:hypothetical protein